MPEVVLPLFLLLIVRCRVEMCRLTPEVAIALLLLLPLLFLMSLILRYVMRMQRVAKCLEPLTLSNCFTLTICPLLAANTRVFTAEVWGFANSTASLKAVA